MEREMLKQASMPQHGFNNMDFDEAASQVSYNLSDVTASEAAASANKLHQI